MYGRSAGWPHPDRLPASASPVLISRRPAQSASGPVAYSRSPSGVLLSSLMPLGVRRLPYRLKPALSQGQAGLKSSMEVGLTPIERGDGSSRPELDRGDSARDSSGSWGFSSRNPVGGPGRAAGYAPSFPGQRWLRRVYRALRAIEPTGFPDS